MKQIKVAITGSIGSGKSVFCNYLREHGYPVISADEESKNILASDPGVKKEIVKSFGKESYLPDLSVNRKYLAEKVFPDPVNLQTINSILHPRVINRIDELFRTIYHREHIVFVEAALVYEADMEELFDYVVLVTADEEVRKQRKAAQNITEEDFIQRNQNQIPDEEKKKRADFVFLNDGSLDKLKSKAAFLISVLKAIP